MNKSYSIIQDWQANRKYTKGKLITVCFRIAHLASRNSLMKILLMPYLIIYKLIFEWILGIEIPYNLNIGKGFVVWHGPGLIIHRNSIIGSNCTLRHATTIGNKGFSNIECPKIGNNVNIGAHVCILGNIIVGDNAIIGAGSIVIKDVPSNAVVAGNPARIVNYNSPSKPELSD
ncbi:Serine acetyltransferase [Arcticibacter svalbardensis MN12-7]|uniref:Serine acetyltransferase n=1 Tax=Arcticibacter svalbardensis MN12-7 TaxID=1150600 RepID=R9GQU2_9SPHI|nr:serine acetyltransferase [Arcticibacter svalbardensis]EOR94086.1 Serine acetyltransferase [Arcticibacter svalbardensis MN12-7]